MSSQPGWAAMEEASARRVADRLGVTAADVRSAFRDVHDDPAAWMSDGDARSFERSFGRSLARALNVSADAMRDALRAEHDHFSRATRPPSLPRGSASERDGPAAPLPL